MDALGWCILLFTLLVLGAPFVLYLRRMGSIPTWPTAVALITEFESFRGTPLPKYSYASDHCKVYYAFSVGRKTYQGWFVLMTEDHGYADDTAEKLRGKELNVRYNPKRPNDSVLIDDEVLGKKVIQNRSLLDSLFR